MSATILVEQQQPPPTSHAPVAPAAQLAPNATAPPSTSATTTRAHLPAADTSASASASASDAAPAPAAAAANGVVPPAPVSASASASAPTVASEPSVPVAPAANIAVPTADAEPPATAPSPSPANGAAAPAAPEPVPVRSGTTHQAQLALLHARVGVQLQFVEAARRKIADETHADLQLRLRKLERERDALLARATQRDAYLRHSTAVLFAYECAEATSEFELSCEKLRHDMLDEIQHEMALLHSDRSGSASASARTTTRKTRSTRTKTGEKDFAGALGSAGGSGSGVSGGAGAHGSGSAAFALDAAARIKKRAGNVFQPLEKRLAPSEVDFDLRELHALLDASKKRRMDVPAAEDLPTVRCHRGKLLYRDAIFCDGDDVFVQHEASGAAYVAVVAGVTSTQLVLLSERGKVAQVVLSDLRQGAVALSALSHEQSAALGARDERARHSQAAAAAGAGAGGSSKRTV